MNLERPKLHAAVAMDITSLDTALSSVSAPGPMMMSSPAKRFALSLRTLQLNCTSRLYFWGIISGSSADYYILYKLMDTRHPHAELAARLSALEKNDSENKEADATAQNTDYISLPTKFFYYSVELEEDFKELRCPLVKRDALLNLWTEFSGNPETPLFQENRDKEDQSQDDEQSPPLSDQPSKPRVTERDRLAAVVQFIDLENSVVPLKSHRINEAQQVFPHPLYQGMGVEEAMSLASWTHLRRPLSLFVQDSLQSEKFQIKAKFLDTLDEEEPYGCWQLRHDVLKNTVNVRSLAWPGYSAYCVLGSPVYGSVYFGKGLKNHYLPFFLP